MANPQPTSKEQPSSLALDETRIRILKRSLETGAFGRGDFPIIRKMIEELS